MTTPNQTIGLRRRAYYAAFFFAIFSLPLFFAPSVSLAKTCVDPDGKKIENQTTCDPPLCEVGKICNPTKYKDIDELLLAVVGVAVQYGLLLIVFFLVLAGFKFVVAQGNPEKINDAKKMLVWVVVGAFVLLGVYVIRAAVCGTIDAITPGSPPTCQ